MRRRISSSDLWLYKFLLPVTSVLVFGLAAALCAASGLFSLSSGDRVTGIGLLILALVVPCFAVFLCIVWLRLPHVEVDESRFHAWGWRKKIEVPFSDIKSVSQQGWLVVVRLRERSAMGRVIRFMPQWKNLPWWGPQLPWASGTHSIVDELQVLVREAISENSSSESAQGSHGSGRGAGSEPP